jgi:endoglucanase
MSHVTWALVFACLGGPAAAQDAGHKEPQKPAATTAAVVAAPAMPKPAPAESIPNKPKQTPEKPLFNALGNGPAWHSYKAHFVTAEGRVVDTGNKGISHSEGQGYGMLFAVAAGDRDAFQRIWDWTRGNLMVREDFLLAWRWEPDKRPGIADINDATDGDILVAWALVEAADAWSDEGYRVAARRIALAVGKRTVLFKTRNEPLLLPGMVGFSAEDRADGPIVNLSYFVFPAFPRLAEVAAEIDWDSLTQTGLDLVQRARFGSQKLPTDWISMSGQVPKPAAGFAPVFSYNAIRIPLYLVWAGVIDQKDLDPFIALWSARTQSSLPIVDTSTGQIIKWLDEPGYSAIADLVFCAVSDKALPSGFTTPAANESYYPATLHLLAMIAAKMRYDTCLTR